MLKSNLVQKDTHTVRGTRKLRHHHLPSCQSLIRHLPSSVAAKMSETPASHSLSHWESGQMHFSKLLILFPWSGLPLNFPFIFIKQAQEKQVRSVEMDFGSNHKREVLF